MARRPGALSKRELLIIQAKRMRLRFSPSISENQLQNLIDSQPATDDQKDYISQILKRLGRKCPDSLTYGQARKAMALACETDNQYAIAALKLAEGAYIEWNGEHFLITKILSDRAMYKMIVQKVVLRRPDGEAKAIATATEDTPQTINPYQILFLSHVVDLTNWPERDFWPSLSEDEPAF